jgi:hypothetical protein
MTEMDNLENEMLHSSGMILLSLIIFIIAVFVLPWFVGLYNPDPQYDLADGKMMLESIKVVGGGLLIAGSIFTFLLGTGWLIISIVFYGLKKINKLFGN